MDAIATPEDAFAEAVRRAGGQSAFARIVGKKQPTISHRLKRRLPATPDEVRTIERELGIPKEQLRPDLYPPDLAVAPAPATRSLLAAAP